MKQTKAPVINARNATDVTRPFFSGHSELKLPIIIPSDDGLAKPHTANVAILELRNCEYISKYK